jgi:hypothetical protein
VLRRCSAEKIRPPDLPQHLNTLVTFVTSLHKTERQESGHNQPHTKVFDPASGRF